MSPASPMWQLPTEHGYLMPQNKQFDLSCPRSATTLRIERAATGAFVKATQDGGRTQAVGDGSRPIVEAAPTTASVHWNPIVVVAPSAALQ